MENVATASNTKGGQTGPEMGTPTKAPTKSERMNSIENECTRLGYIVSELEEKVALLQQAVVNRGSVGRMENFGAGGGAKKRIPEPQLYSRMRNAKEVDNFLFDMEQYFIAADIDDESEKIATATMYLTGDAKQWWRGKYQDIRDRHKRLDTWDLLQEAIRRQFFPENVGYNARKALRELKQTGTVNEYTKAFASILLDLPKMDEESKIYQFMDGLKPWAREEGTSPPTPKRVPKKARTKAAYDGATKLRGTRSSTGAIYTSKKKEKEPAPVPEECEEDSESEGENLRAFSHRATGEPSTKSTKEKGLMFVDVKINGKPIRAMVDTGATHNYLASTEVERLGLVLEKGAGRVKAINSAAQPIAGVAKSVLIKVGPYEGRTNLSIVTMDDFKLILGLDFLRDTKTAVMPHAGALMMMGNKPCVAQTVSPRTSSKPLSAMQFVKGCRKNEPSFLCTLRVEDIEEKSGKIPEVVKRILQEFEDVMPDELPKKLPLKRAVDHEIKMVPGTKPPTRAPYRMSYPELEELRKQLKELLESGLIRPVKSPYGAPVLFQKKSDGTLRMFSWEWTPQAQSAFEKLKKAIMSDPVLAFPDLTKPFVVETDASEFALGGVLTQGAHPVAFESRKLKDVERHYPVHEKELLAIVHCLRQWRHYLLGFPFVVKTDNTAVSYFLTKPKLTAKQTRWQELLAEFNFSLEYRAGSSNHVADALSRRTDLKDQPVMAALTSSKATTDLKNRIRELTKEDPTAQGLLNLVEQKKTRNFWLEEGFLKTKGNRLYVPKGGDLRRTIIAECHDTLWAGHPGEERTVALAGLLEPLPIPSRPWESVSMDFITGLPKVGDLDAIVVVVDRFSKYATFVPAPKTITAEETAQLFFKHIVKFWGLLRDIVSDRDSRFTGNFWTELFKLLGSKLHMSSSFHPQSDGQTEHFNSMLEEYLRHFVSANQKDWVKLLDAAQLCFNAQKCSTTNGTPFEICTGQQPLLPYSIDAPQGARVSPAQSFSLEWKRNLDLARSYLEKAQQRMKKYADQKRRFVEYRVGDRIMVKVPDQRLSKASRGRDARLMSKYIGPLTILQRIGKVAYRVELPPWWQIHNVIHVSQLKPFQADKVDATRTMPDRPQLRLANDKGKRIAEAILCHRDAAKRKKLHREYLVKWEGCPKEESTWERATTLKAFQLLIDAYLMTVALRTSPTPEGESCHGMPPPSYPLSQDTPGQVHSLIPILGIGNARPLAAEARRAPVTGAPAPRATRTRLGHQH
ncbi:hypothetical protein C2S51_001213 [Perilla frutescens var. frutescens]|nr:hypothetical protein C2S51_001213 [Perilla frutescens var. frutescens]